MNNKQWVAPLIILIFYVGVWYGTALADDTTSIFDRLSVLLAFAFPGALGGITGYWLAREEA